MLGFIIIYLRMSPLSVVFCNKLINKSNLEVLAR